MMITDRARKFYKEAMAMEDYYRNPLMIGLMNHYSAGYITAQELKVLPDFILERFNKVLS